MFKITLKKAKTPFQAWRKHKKMYKIEITLDRMFLYTFEPVKGYFCSLLISNIFLYTSLSQFRKFFNKTELSFKCFYGYCFYSSHHCHLNFYSDLLKASALSFKTCSEFYLKLFIPL